MEFGVSGGTRLWTEFLDEEYSGGGHCEVARVLESEFIQREFPVPYVACNRLHNLWYAAGDMECIVVVEYETLTANGGLRKTVNLVSEWWPDQSPGKI